MQIYCVRGVHFSQIKCVEWSQNTLKLFSGDKDGYVACSEMDYGKVRLFNLGIAYFVQCQDSIFRAAKCMQW